MFEQSSKEEYILNRGIYTTVLDRGRHQNVTVHLDMKYPLLNGSCETSTYMCVPISVLKVSDGRACQDPVGVPRFQMLLYKHDNHSEPFGRFDTDERR